MPFKFFKQFFDARRTIESVALSNLFMRYSNMSLVFVSGLILVPTVVSNVPAELYSFWLSTLVLQAVLQNLDFALPVVVQQRLSAKFDDNNLSGLKITAVASIWSGLVVALVVLMIAETMLWITFTFSFASSKVLQENYMVFALAIFANTVNIFAFSISGVIIGLQSRIAQGLIALLSTSCLFFVTYITVLSGFGLIALPLGMLVSGIIIAAGGLLYAYYRLRGLPATSLKIYYDESLTLFRVGKNLAFSRALIGSVNFIDLLILKYFVSDQVLISYFLTKKAIDISRDLLSQVLASIMTAGTRLAQKAKRLSVNAGQIPRGWMLITIALAIFCSGGILIFNEGFVSIWIGVQYYQGTVVNTALALSFLFVVIGNSLVSLSLSLGHFSYVAALQLTQSLLCIVFSALFGMQFGLLGVIFAMPLSWVSAIYFCREKTEDIKYLNIDRFSSKIILVSMIIIIITCVLSFLWKPSLSNILDYFVALSIYILTPVLLSVGLFYRDIGPYLGAFRVKL